MMTLRLNGRHLGAMLAFALCAKIALAADGPATFQPVTARQPLVVGAPTEIYPYSYLDEHGQWAGFSTEVLDAVARVMHLQITRQRAQPTQLQERFRGGEFDLLQHFQQSASREAFADFSVPLLTLQGAVFVRQGGPIHSIADLEGADFVVFTANDVGERFLASRGVHVRPVIVASLAEALRSVSEGRCAGTFLSKLTALAVIDQNHLRGVVPLGDAVEGFDVRHCFAVHKGDAQLLARVNEGLAILHQTGEYDRIYRKWFGKVGGILFTREELVSYAAAALALACLVALWVLWRERVLRRSIEQLNAGLERRVAERTAELDARVAEVEKLNQELEAFSYSVSHDLRAPLRNITGFLELLSRRTTGRLDDEEVRYVSTVSREATRMGGLIDDLLELSRLGRTEMKAVRVEPAELIEEIRIELQQETAGRVIEWKIGALPPVHGDRTLLRQVLSNLIGNAVKFSRQRATATIEVAAISPEGEDGTVTFLVRDNGAGFNPAYTGKLFGVFQRLHNQRDFEGTGIGLANVKRIVERHGGRVWAEGAVDRGATFFFSLPRFAEPT
jgi:signal transduction histidine kinase